MCNFPLPCNSLLLMPSLKTPFPPFGSISAELWGNSILLMMRQISGLLKLVNTCNYTATILNLTRKIIITEEIRPFSLSFSLSVFCGGGRGGAFTLLWRKFHLCRKVPIKRINGWLVKVNYSKLKASITREFVIQSVSQLEGYKVVT